MSARPGEPAGSPGLNLSSQIDFPAALEISHFSLLYTVSTGLLISSL